MYRAPVPLIELTDDELALLLAALEEAAFFRDARSNVVRSAVRRRDRRAGSASASDADTGAEHRQRARDYQSLAVKLTQARRRAPS